MCLCVLKLGTPSNRVKWVSQWASLLWLRCEPQILWIALIIDIELASKTNTSRWINPSSGEACTKTYRLSDLIRTLKSFRTKWVNLHNIKKSFWRKRIIYTNKQNIGNDRATHGHNYKLLLESKHKYDIFFKKKVLSMHKKY